jgi:hypothetical protein
MGQALLTSFGTTYTVPVEELTRCVQLEPSGRRPDRSRNCFPTNTVLAQNTHHEPLARIPNFRTCRAEMRVPEVLCYVHYHCRGERNSPALSDQEPY